MLAVFAAPVLVSPPVSFFLIASVSFLCRTYVGLMSWPVLLASVGVARFLVFLTSDARQLFPFSD